MTLTVGVLAIDGIVMASDSRLSSDVYSNDSVEKIIPLGQNKAIGYAGQGNIAKHIIDLLIEEKTIKEEWGIQMVAEKICEVFSKAYDKYFAHLKPEQRPPLELLLTGYTNEIPPIPLIYELYSGKNFVPEQISVGHSSIGIPHIANYLLNRIHEKDKMYQTEAELLSVLCIKESKHQYNSVGGDIRVATFAHDKSFTVLTRQEVSKIEKELNDMQGFQRYKFYPENA